MRCKRLGPRRPASRHGNGGGGYSGGGLPVTRLLPPRLVPVYAKFLNTYLQNNPYSTGAQLELSALDAFCNQTAGTSPCGASLAHQLLISFLTLGAVAASIITPSGGGAQDEEPGTPAAELRIQATAQQELAQLGAAEEPLPALKGTIAESFKGGQYTTQTFKAGTTFCRAEGWNVTGPGSFLGTEPVDISNEAEQAYNVDKWSNPRQVMRIYRLNQDVTMYYGEVAGGEGYQALIPRGINPADILTQIGARALP